MSGQQAAVVRVASDVRELLAATVTRAAVSTLRVNAWPGMYPLRRGEAPPPEAYERVEYVHRVDGLPLLEQLARAVAGAAQAPGDPEGGGGYASKPAARLDAVSQWQRIDRESALWLHLLGGRRRAPVARRLGLLAAAAADAPDALLLGDERDRTVPRGGLSRAARGWLVGARVVTGWERPTWAPNVPCPVAECERRGTIRIRLEQGVGLCTACGEFWDRDALPRLGEYVRWAAEHLRGREHVVFAADGELRVCEECAAVRDAMGERVAGRRAARIPA